MQIMSQLVRSYQVSALMTRFFVGLGEVNWLSHIGEVDKGVSAARNG